MAKIARRINATIAIARVTGSELSKLSQYLRARYINPLFTRAIQPASFGLAREPQAVPALATRWAPRACGTTCIGDARRFSYRAYTPPHHPPSILHHLPPTPT